MAQGLTVDRPIYQGVRHLPAEQEPNALPMSTPIQDPGPRQCTPIHTNSNGPDHGAP